MSITKLRLYRKAVVIYYAKYNSTYRHSTGVNIGDKFTPKQIDYISTQFVKDNFPSILSDVEPEIINAQTLVEKKITSYREKNNNQYPSVAKLKQLLKQKDIVRSNSRMFIDVYDDFIAEKRKYYKKKGSAASLSTFNSLKKSILDFQDEKKIRLEVDGFDEFSIEEFANFLRTPREKGARTKGGLNNQTFNKRLSNLGNFYKWIDENYETYKLNIYQEVKKHLIGERQPLPEKSIFVLSKEDMKLMRNHTPSNQSQERAQDLFTICCYMGLRWGDVLSTRRHHFSEERGKILFRKKAEKTRNTIEQYVPNFVFNIFDKYHFNMSNILSNPKANKHIKLMLMDIDEFNEESDKHFEDDEKTIKIKKYKLCTMHTGRRSFISYILNTLKLSPVEVMQYTDHVSLRTINSYASVSSGWKEKQGTLWDED